MLGRKSFNRALRRRPTVWVWAALAMLVASALVETQRGTSRPSPSVEEWFTERAQAVGLDFVHFNGMSGEYYFEEVMGSGVALLDFDNDGDLDVYLIQGQILGGKTLADAVFPPRMPPTDRLYRNDLQVNADGSRTIHFT